MKRQIFNIGIVFGLFFTLFLSACKEDIDPIVEELAFDRAFSPINIEYTIEKSINLSLKWTAGVDIDHYTVEIYSGVDFTPASLLYTEDVPAITPGLKYELPAGDTQYSARVKSVSSIEGVEDSKWSGIEFRTPPENLFEGYQTLMTGIGSITVRWAPGETVTDLIFVDGTNETSYPITADELADGEKSLVAIPNALYEIRLSNASFVRGRLTFKMEGDVLLPVGGNLNDALDAMPAGGVLILANGENFVLTEPDTVTLSIKIRGLYPDNLPKIYLVAAGGNHLFDIDPSMTLADSLVFENVDISCAYDDNPTTRHRGIIDQENTPFAIGAIKFNNCILRNSGRSAIRLRGNAAGQVINNTEFNNCILYDFAFDSHYGVLNGALTGNFINIKFSNSTIYNIRGGIINYGNGAGCLSVIADNCTFDRITMDAVTGRYFIDFGTGSNTSTGSISISDCIFGQTVTLANGVRNSSMSLAVTGSYFTSDYVNVASSITTLMTPYAGASTSLWTNPSGGIFTFSDISFVGKDDAGDPRWKP